MQQIDSIKITAIFLKQHLYRLIWFVLALSIKFLESNQS